MLEIWSGLDEEMRWVIIISFLSIVIGLTGFTWFFISNVKNKR